MAQLIEKQWLSTSANSEIKSVKCARTLNTREAYFNLESLFSPEPVGFAALQVRLIRAVQNRLNNGEFSERGLAKLLGVSQPQLHNVLKGARRLQPDLADLLMSKLEMSVTDLLSRQEMMLALDRQSPAFVQPIMAPRKPAGRLESLRGAQMRYLG